MDSIDEHIDPDFQDAEPLRSRVGASPISILSTALLNSDIALEAHLKGYSITILPFISTKPVIDVSLLEKVGQLATVSINVTFTSKHAVMAVAEMLKGKTVNWQIICLSNETLKAVNQLFTKSDDFTFNGSVVGAGANALALATSVINMNVKKIVFFSGESRLDVLPSLLEKAGVVVEEHHVYKIEHTPHVVNISYDGILFFSPSGVDSYFSKNKVAPGQVLFAIGSTTAKSLKEYTDNKIIVGSKPIKRQLLEEAICYFKSGSSL